MTNCLFEATLQKIERECNCTPKYFIDVAKGYEACEGKAKKCMTKLTNEMGSVRMIDDAGATKECLAVCVDQVHTVLVTAAAFPSIYSFYQSREYCIVVEKLRRSCAGDRRESLDQDTPDLCKVIEEMAANDIPCDHELGNSSDAVGQIVMQVQREVALYARKNMATINIYIREPYVKKYLSEEKITEINFVGTVGGILGLFLGFSFVSIVEIFYFIIYGESRKREINLVGDSGVTKVRPADLGGSTYGSNIKYSSDVFK
jgi:hypothetical protein